MKLKFNRETLEVKGRLVSSISNGYKLINGKPVYTLSMCLFRDPTHRFVFPSIEDLVGEYIDESGNRMLLRKFPSGTLSAVIKKRLPDGALGNLFYESGHYYPDSGLMSFP